MNELLKKMIGIGLIVESLDMDKQIHRVAVGGKNKKNGWYIGYHLDDTAIICIFGRWDTGEKYDYCSKVNLTPVDRKIIEFINAKAKQEKKEKQKAAKVKAQEIWDKALISYTHSYLIKKQVKPYIAKSWNNFLIIPIFNQKKELVNLQLIDKEGNKKFLTGGQVKDCACSVGDNDNVVCLCEGFATGASIHEATGYKVIIVFNASNLVSIAIFVAQAYPNSKIIICADNDYSNDKNTGIEAGKKASDKINAVLRFPTDIQGTDFNDLAIEKGFDAVKQVIDQTDIKILTPDKLEDQSLTLNLSNPKLFPPLIKLGIDALPDHIIQYSYPAIISVLARTIAGKLRFNTVWPSMYHLKIGGTSTGKTSVDLLLKNNIIRYEMHNFYGCTDFSSGIGLLRSLEESPQTLINMDEITYLFKDYQKNDPIRDSKIQALLEINTCAGSEIKKTYSDKKKTFIVNQPCLIFIGNATPLIFNNFSLDDMESGLIQRFDFWCYDGKIPHRENKDDNNNLDKFFTKIKQLYDYKFTNQDTIEDIISPCKNLSISPQAEKLLNDYSYNIINFCNQQDKEHQGVIGIISRKYFNAIKYAMVHIVASRETPEDILSPIDIQDIEYGILISDLLADWKILTLMKKISCGEFHQNCQNFLESIKIIQKTGRNPTGSLMVNRKPALKKIKPQEWKDIITVLKARNEIISEEKNGKTYYFLIEKEVF